MLVDLLHKNNGHKHVGQHRSTTFNWDMINNDSMFWWCWCRRSDVCLDRQLPSFPTQTPNTHIHSGSRIAELYESMYGMPLHKYIDQIIQITDQLNINLTHIQRSVLYAHIFLLLVALAKHYSNYESSDLVSRLAITFCTQYNEKKWQLQTRTVCARLWIWRNAPFFRSFLVKQFNSCCAPRVFK